MEPSHHLIQEPTGPLPDRKSRGFTPFNPNTVIEWELNDRTGTAVAVKSAYNGLHAIDFDPNTGDTRHVHVPWTAMIQEVPRRKHLSGLVMHLFMTRWEEETISRYGEQLFEIYIAHPDRTKTTKRADYIELAQRFHNSWGELAIKHLLDDDDALMMVARAGNHLEQIGRHLKSQKLMMQFILGPPKSATKITLSVLARVTMRTKLFEIAASTTEDAVAEAAYSRLGHVTMNEGVELTARTPAHDFIEKILAGITSEAEIIQLCCASTKQFTAPQNHSFIGRINRMFDGPNERKLSPEGYKTILRTSPHHAMCSMARWKLRRHLSREEIERLVRENPNLSETTKANEHEELAHYYENRD